VLSKYDSLAASVRQRFQLYAPLFKENGIELKVSPLFDRQYLEYRFRNNRVRPGTVLRCYWRRFRALLSASKWDLVIIHCDALPYVPSWVESLLMKRGIRYVFDFDDAIFHQYDESSNLIVRWMLGNKVAKVIRSAALVFAGSDYLAEYAKRTNENVIVVPTVVDTDQFPLKSHREIPPEDPVVIGWIGSPSTTTYLSDLLPAIEAFARTRPVKLIAIGATPLGIKAGTVENRDWSEETEIPDLLDCDIGIMPLTDVPWARGKCAFKLIQYMACGLPVVASPVGANVEVVQNNVGFLANDDQQWRSAFQQLADDANLRNEMGQSGRRFVCNRFSLQVTGPTVLNSLQKLMDVY